MYGFEKFEWDGDEITFYRKGESFGCAEFVPGSITRKLFSDLRLHCVGNDYPSFVLELGDE